MTFEQSAEWREASGGERSGPRQQLQVSSAGGTFEDHRAGTRLDCPGGTEGGSEWEKQRLVRGWEPSGEGQVASCRKWQLRETLAFG